MKSMTSYGYAEYACDEFLMTMEIKSYNNRFLEVSYYSPVYLSAYEQEITEIIKKSAKRGHVDVSVRIKSLRGDYQVSVDEGAVEAYINAALKIRDACKEKGLDPEFRLSDIMNAEGVLCTVNSDCLDKYRKALEKCSKEAIYQFESAKAREGEITKKDLVSKIDSIDKSLSVVKANIAGLDQMIKDNLTSRIKEMLGNQDYDENRILTEVAVMLVRYTINEETVRLSAHISEFRRLLDSNEAIGKRIDFLTQEMNREINTIGSKSQMVEINFEVVNMKDCLEDIREQMRNIE